MEKKIIIFLDFDGVLHSQEWFNEMEDAQDFDMNRFNPAAVERLNKLVAATNAKIVVSSSWRYGRSIEQLRELLKKNGVEGEVIDACKCTFSFLRRDMEVFRWIKEYGVPDAFVALDDDLSILQYGRCAVNTTWERGLLDEHVDEAAASIKEQLEGTLVFDRSKFEFKPGIVTPAPSPIPDEDVDF